MVNAGVRLEHPKCDAQRLQELTTDVAYFDSCAQYRGGMPDEPTTEGVADPGYDDAGVPTFESVRDKIEARYSTAQGSAELDAESPEGRSVEDEYDERRRAAAERLAQIRESMRRDGDA